MVKNFFLQNPESELVNSENLQKNNARVFDFSPVPNIEALALPDRLERATPQPTQYMYIARPKRAGIHNPQASPLPCPESILEMAKSQCSENKALVTP